VPLERISVAGEAAEVPLMVRRFPDVPAALNCERVVLVAAKLIVLATPLVLVMFLNVLLPEIVNVPAPA